MMNRKVIKEIFKFIKPIDYIRYFMTLIVLFFVVGEYGLFLAVIFLIIAGGIELQNIVINMMSKHLETINEILKNLMEKK